MTLEMKIVPCILDHLFFCFLGLEMNGRFKFVMDWSNGKVLSERAYKMLKDDHQSRILEEHVVVLNPEGEVRHQIFAD